MSVQERVAQRGIKEVLHFTTNRGIVGILATGELRSRHRLPEDKFLEQVLHVNAAQRPEAAEFFDKTENWLDYVNLSISEINRRYFEVSQRWHENKDIWWGILSFDPEVMSHERVVFTTTNNAYEPYCVRKIGPEGLDLLFEPTIRRKATWYAYRGTRANHLTTCEQAEVLYPAVVHTQYLRRIYVGTGDQQDQTRGWLREFELPNVEVVIDAAKYLGKKN